MRNVLITGGAGFIGAEIVNQLHCIVGYNVTVLDSMSEQIHGADWHNSYLYKKIEDKCRFIKGSVCDLPVVCEAIKNCDVVIHLHPSFRNKLSLNEMSEPLVSQ